MDAGFAHSLFIYLLNNIAKKRWKWILHQPHVFLLRFCFCFISILEFGSLVDHENQKSHFKSDKNLHFVRLRFLALRAPPLPAARAPFPGAMALLSPQCYFLPVLRFQKQIPDIHRQTERQTANGAGDLLDRQLGFIRDCLEANLLLIGLYCMQ